VRRVWALAFALAGCGASEEVADVTLSIDAPPDTAAVSRALAGLRPAIEVEGRAPIRWSVAERLAHHRIPGVSIAVIDAGRVVWAGGFGVKEAGTADPVTAATLFQAASISKPVTATGMLRLVAEGRLDLDADVNRYLRSWRVPENRHTAREKVTLRRIASHSAGLTQHGFRGYAEGEPVPTVAQLLDGANPANHQAVRVDTTPGSLVRYSGGGTTVQQLVMTDVTGEAFPALMKRLVLDPAGMRRSTFEQPLPMGRWSDAARGHRPDGTMIRGRWHTYPEMAAAGLWTTPTDLARWAFAIESARSGRDTTILPRALAEAMLTRQAGDYGIGPALGGSDSTFRFGHNGANEGFRATLTFFPVTGQGAAIMVNSDRGSELANEILNALAAELGWPARAPRVIREVRLDGDRLARHVGTYAYEFQGRRSSVAITVDSGRLWLRPDDEPYLEELVPTDSSGTFTLIPGGWRVVLAGDSARISPNATVTFTARRRR
jgi:CubicO group peptidase (beta-lactamase class C family)